MQAGDPARALCIGLKEERVHDRSRAGFGARYYKGWDIASKHLCWSTSQWRSRLYCHGVQVWQGATQRPVEVSKMGATLEVVAK